MGVVEFEAWPKTPRLNRDIVITEKIDGTNSAIQIIKLTEENSFEVDEDLRQFTNDTDNAKVTAFYFVDGEQYAVIAQSRNRIITPGKGTDNAGFAGWVRVNGPSLVADLGEGIHYGEWWGQSIQHGYGMDRKVFSLFNTHHWGAANFKTENLRVVPVLYAGPFSQNEINKVLEDLNKFGSYARAFHPKPEGIIIYHTAAKQVFKVLCENDEIPKGLA